MRSEATPGFGGGRAPSFHFGQGSAASEAPDASPPAPWSYLPYYVGEAEKARVQVPYVVSLSTLCVYAAPTIISIRLGTDPDAAFWIGRVGLVACLVPVFLALMHLVHSAELARGRARRSTVSITAIVPGVVLAVTGIVYSAESAFLQSHLMSDDCIARSSQPLSEKPRLQAAYALGLRAYAACQERHYDDNGREMLPRSPHPTLQQCTQWRTADDSLVLGEDLVTWRGYVDEQTVAEWFLGSLGFDLVSKNYWADRPQREHTYYWREWDYLAQVEANHFCGGFCEPGPSLFVDYDLSGRQGGKCAPLVGLKFGVVQYQAQLVLWTSVISLVLVIAVLFPLAMPHLKELGYTGLDDR